MPKSWPIDPESGQDLGYWGLEPPIRAPTPYLSGKRFLDGDQFTLADIAVFPLLMHFEALGFDWAGHTPALAADVEACKARPSVQQSGWVETFAAARQPALVLAD